MNWNWHDVARFIEHHEILFGIVAITAWVGIGLLLGNCVYYGMHDSKGRNDAA